MWVCACQQRCLKRPEESVGYPVNCLVWMLGPWEEQPALLSHLFSPPPHRLQSCNMSGLHSVHVGFTKTIFHCVFTTHIYHKVRSWELGDERAMCNTAIEHSYCFFLKWLAFGLQGHSGYIHVWIKIAFDFNHSVLKGHLWRICPSPNWLLGQHSGDTGKWSAANSRPVWVTWCVPGHLSEPINLAQIFLCGRTTKIMKTYCTTDNIWTLLT